MTPEYTLTPATRLRAIYPDGLDAFDTDWSDFCAANHDAPEVIEDARDQLTKVGLAFLGGGASPEIEMWIV